MFISIRILYLRFVVDFCDHRNSISSVNRIKESARALVVLDVDGKVERMVSCD